MDKIDHLAEYIIAVVRLTPDDKEAKAEIIKAVQQYTKEEWSVK